MSWRSTVYLSKCGYTHVWTEPNFSDYEEEKTEIFISNNRAIDGEDEVCFLLDSEEGQAIYNAFMELNSSK